MNIDFGMPLHVFNGMEAITLAAILTAGSAIVGHSKAIAGGLLTLGILGLAARNVLAMRVALEQGRQAEDMLGTIAIRTLISAIALLAAGWPTTCHLAWVPEAQQRAPADNTKTLTGFSGSLPPRHVDIASMLAETDFGRAVLHIVRPQSRPFNVSLVEPGGTPGSSSVPGKVLYPLAINGGFVVPLSAVAVWDLMSWVVERTLRFMHMTGFFTPDVVPPMMASDQLEAQSMLSDMRKLYQNAPEIEHRLALADKGFAELFNAQMLLLRDMTYRLDGPDWTMGSPHTRDFARLLRGETLNADIAFGRYHFPHVVQGGGIQFYPGAPGSCPSSPPTEYIPFVSDTNPDNVCFYYDIRIRNTNERTVRHASGVLSQPVPARDIAFAFQQDPTGDPPPVEVVPSPWTLLARAGNDLGELRARWTEYSKAFDQAKENGTPQVLDPRDPTSPTGRITMLMITNGLELLYIADMIDPTRAGQNHASVNIPSIFDSSFLAGTDPALKDRYLHIYSLATDPARAPKGRWGIALCNALGVDPASKDEVPTTLNVLARLLRHYGDLSIRSALRLMRYADGELKVVSNMAGLRGSTGIGSAIGTGAAAGAAAGGVSFIVKKALARVGHFIASAASRASPVSFIIGIAFSLIGLIAKTILLILYIAMIVRVGLSFVRLQFIGPVAAFAGTENVIWNEIASLINRRLWTLFFIIAGFIAYVGSELFASAIPVVSSAAGGNLTYIVHAGLAMLVVGQLSNLFSYSTVNPFFGTGGAGGSSEAAGGGGGSQSPAEYEATRKGGASAMSAAALAAAAPLGAKAAGAAHGAAVGLGEGLQAALQKAGKTAASSAASAGAGASAAGAEAAASTAGAIAKEAAAQAAGRGGFRLRPAASLTGAGAEAAEGAAGEAAARGGLSVIEGGLTETGAGRGSVRRKRGSGKGEAGGGATGGGLPEAEDIAGQGADMPRLTSGDHGILGSMLEGAAKGWTHPDRPILVTAGRWATLFSEFYPREGQGRYGLLYKLNQAMLRSAAESMGKHRSWSLNKSPQSNGPRTRNGGGKDGETY